MFSSKIQGFIGEVEFNPAVFPMGKKFRDKGAGASRLAAFQLL